MNTFESSPLGFLSFLCLNEDLQDIQYIGRTSLLAQMRHQNKFLICTSGRSHFWSNRGRIGSPKQDFRMMSAA